MDHLLDQFVRSKGTGKTIPGNGVISNYLFKVKTQKKQRGCKTRVNTGKHHVKRHFLLKFFSSKSWMWLTAAGVQTFLCK